MSTRKAQGNAPLSQERYMSSPEYAELRGISGTAVAPRAAIVADLAMRKLLWVLQARSLEQGGLMQLACDILKQYKDRVSRYAPETFEGRQATLANFIIDLCVNPESKDVYWFEDIVGALLDYQRKEEEAARADFVLTDIGRKVWETLDFALKANRMVVVEGWEGRGKSEAVKAWCRCHQGEARFVDLAGVTSKTTVFRAIAKALGIASSYARTATEMQARIEDVLHRSRLMLLVDEAHFLFNQSARIYSRPELVDWIDTALCNHDVPVALITTPQFINCVKRAETQVGWNWRQFRRRVRRWVVLPEWNSDADLEAVARKVLPGISKAGIKLAVGYAKISLHGSPSRDVSGLGDVATEARLNAETAGRVTVSFEDVERAINDHLLPSDTGFAARMADTIKPARRRAGNGSAPPLQSRFTPATARGMRPLQPLEAA